MRGGQIGQRLRTETDAVEGLAVVAQGQTLVRTAFQVGPGLSLHMLAG